MPITSAVIEAANRFRQAILARERQAATRLVSYYGETWRGLQQDIDKLEAQIEQMREAGEEVSEATIGRLGRMQTIQKQAATEALKFSQYASGAITEAQSEAIAAGERDAYALLQASFPAGVDIDISFVRMPAGAVESLAGYLADGSPLANLLRERVGSAAKQFGEMMVRGLASGWNPRKLARELRRSYGMGLTDALRIARSEQMRAYRTSSINGYRQNSDIVTGWMRLAAHNDRTCMACVMLDGTVYTLEEEMEDHPNGRCTLVPITKTYEELGIDAPEPDFSRETGEEWFLKQDEATQREMMGALYGAWQDGQFELADIPKRTESAVWGGSWTPATLGELTG